MWSRSTFKLLSACLYFDTNLCCARSRISLKLESFGSIIGIYWDYVSEENTYLLWLQSTLELLSTCMHSDTNLAKVCNFFVDVSRGWGSGLPKKGVHSRRNLRKIIQHFLGKTVNTQTMIHSKATRIYSHFWRVDSSTNFFKIKIIILTIYRI